MNYTLGFERWWKTYPPPRRKDKVKCFAKWKLHRLEDRTDEVVSKLEADVEYDWRGKDLKFVPLSYTYLNGGRFDDDKPKPPKVSAPRVRTPQNEVARKWWEVCGNFVLISVLMVNRGVSDEVLRSIYRIRQRLGRDVAPTLEEAPETMRTEFGQIFKAEIKRETGLQVPGV